MLKKIGAFVQIARPLNVLIAMLTVFVAGFISPRFQFNVQLILGMLIAGFITAGANIINDIFDLEIDRINKPQRPLPDGRLTKREAFAAFFAFYGVALVLAVFCSTAMLIVAGVIALLLTFYSTSLKRTVLWGNLTVSLASGAAFIYGAMAVGDWQTGIIPAVFAFFFHFGREVVKDLQDVEGDLKHQSLTFAARYEVKYSVILTNLIFLCLIVLTIVPYILGVYGKTYLLIVVFGVHPVLLFTSVLLWFKNDPTTLGKVSHLLKLDMIVGLIAIYFGI